MTDQIKNALPTGGSREAPEISILVPVFNEQDNLTPLYERCRQTLNAYGKPFELLFIDDGSTDESYARIRALFEKDSAVRAVRFVRNFGQQMAITAGLKYARGKVIVLLDADLQTAPEEIPKLVDALGEGVDIVYGVRAQRVGSVMRRLGSWVMSHLLYRLTRIDVPDSASGFIAVDRHLIDRVNLFNEKSRYLNGLFAWLSYGRWRSVSVSHSARHSGKSKYGVWQLVGLTFNFVCNFTELPLRITLYLGAVMTPLSLLVLLSLIGTLLLGFSGRHVDTWIIVAALGVFTGVQLLAVGVLGEYLGRIYREVREQPSFLIHEVLDREGPRFPS
jgi:glycosyltransferase involved in cell wall biosynthesis